MEILILLCLLIIMGLMIRDKKVLHNNFKVEKSYPILPRKSSSIMGQSKGVERQLPSTHSDECLIENQSNQISNFDQEMNTKKNDVQILQEELDEGFRSTPDFEEEEEEWNQYQILNDDNGLAIGVTFEELISVEIFLQGQKSELFQKKAVADIVQKVHGTELFNLLENSIEGASIKIAELLDRSFSSENNSNSSFSQNTNLDGFDIGYFS